MESIIDLILGRFIIRFLGSNIRYLFLSLTKNVTIEELRRKEDEEGRNLYNDFMNAIVGLISFALIIIPLMYLLYLVGLFSVLHY